MKELFNLLLNSHIDIEDHTSIILVELDRNGLILKSNAAVKRLIETDRANNYFQELLVNDSKLRFAKMLTQVKATKGCIRENLHFVGNNDSLPVSYICWISYSENQRLIIYAEPILAIGEKQAIEYAMVNSELAVLTRQLQKSKHEAQMKNKALEDLNLRLNTEIIEKEQTKLELAEARINELEIGARIQKTMLIGQIPDNITSLDISAATYASQTIDGDFYDFFTFDNNCMDFVIGDVMGKGVTASLIGAGCRSQFQRSIAKLLYESKKHIPPSPAYIVNNVHKELTPHLSDIEKFVTINYSRFNLIKNQLIFVDCGHTKTIHYNSSSNEVCTLEFHSLPLGIFEDAQYSENVVRFDIEDVFFFYSDGLTDAVDGENNPFGEDALKETLKTFGRLTASEINLKIREKLSDFSGLAGIKDDVTFVTIKILHH